MTYIHANDAKIAGFIEEVIQDRNSLKTVVADLLAWFDKNVRYSRLNAPFYPLQRSDLDVILMRSGTCGDFSNLIVSVLLTLGYDAEYAYVHRDCYGDEQDHICAAVRCEGDWILIDATQPYRKWHGYKCPHREYELLSPEEFEAKMKKEEAYWIDVADRYGNRSFAGILYAPWIHERIVKETDSTLESIFYLLILNEDKRLTLYAYYMIYSDKCGTIPMMCTITDKTRTYCFSVARPKSIWDDSQWGEKYSEGDIPNSFKTAELEAFIEYLSEDSRIINKSVLDTLSFG